LYQSNETKTKQAMKNVFILMLGLVAGTTSFAQTVDTQAPIARLTITTDQKVKLLVAPEKSTAAVILRDAVGHVLYSENVNLTNGLQQSFDITQLTYGTYEFAIAVGKATVVKTFVVDEQPAQKLVAIRS
jgi:hypothetical protein